MADSPHRYLHGRASGSDLGVAERALSISEQLRQHGLPGLVSLNHLAKRTRVDYQFLRHVVDRTADAYEHFSVARPTGKPRWIAAPEYRLAEVQRWLLHRILDRVPQHPDAWAYVPGRSAVRAAERHVGAAWMLKMDLKDFFHQIDERMVYDLFASLGYSSLLSFEIARICTRMPLVAGASWLPPKYSEPLRHHADEALPYTKRAKRLGYLPQGAPTSGAVANVVARRLDERLSGWAAERRLVYTRYSDDIVFSGGPQTYDRPQAQRYFAQASSIVRQEGWEPNRTKCRIVTPGSRLVVLGLLVDGDRLRLRREMRSQIETHLRGIERFGPAAHASHRHFRDAYGLLNHVRGLIDFAQAVDPHLAQTYQIRLRPFEI